MKDKKVISVKDFGHTKIYIRNDSIVEIRCSDNFTYEKEHIAQNIEYLKSIGTDLLVLNCVAPYTHISADARTFLAEGPHVGFVKAEAFWIQSLAQKILASFYTKIDKPKVPVKFLLDKKESENWLLSYLKTH